jgi:hypothetical protein
MNLWQQKFKNITIYSIFGWPTNNGIHRILIVHRYLFIIVRRFNWNMIVFRIVSMPPEKPLPI